jgi:hypothetical protein
VNKKRTAEAGRADEKENKKSASSAILLRNPQRARAMIR